MRRGYVIWLGLVGVIAVVLAVFASGSSAPIVLGQGGEGVPPHVVDIAPLPGEELALDGTITLYFDLPMDMDSVKTAFAITPQVGGTFQTPDDMTLIFVPDEPLDRAASYTVTLGTGALSADGVALDALFELPVRTVGYLEVSQVLPAPDATMIETASTITVIFNRPVVPLVTVEEMDALPAPLTLEPAAVGEGEWLNTSIYIFRPQRLDGGTTYTATIAAGLADVTGGVLEDAYSWSFSTLPPTVQTISPGSGDDDVALDDVITVTFNQAMDTASVEAGFALAGQESGSIVGTFEWNSAGTSFSFQPDEMLVMGDFFTARVDATVARAVNGITSLDETVAWNFVTVGPPRITGTDPVDGRTDAPPWGGVTIYFATPMERDTLMEKVIIEPEPEREYDTYYYSYNNRLEVNFTREPSTDYTITIQPGMADVYGNTIDTVMTFRFRTRAYDADLSLTVPGRIGVYNAYAPQTRLFSTHLNVNQLDLTLYQSSLQDLASITGPNGYDVWRNYSPDVTLRQWTVPVLNEPNQRRYELLTISDQGGGMPVECPGAPESRLAVGATAIVITDPDPLRVRDSAPGGEIIGLLYRDYQLPVVGGPVCANGLYWWQIELRDGTLGWAAEGDNTEYYLDLFTPVLEGATGEEAEVAAGSVGGEEALAPGVYLLRVSAPEVLAVGDEPERHLMVVATANVTLKFSNDTALAWVTDMQSGEPLAGVPVTIYDENYTEVASGTTDGDGLMTAAVPRLGSLYDYLYAVVNDADTFGFAVSDWTWGIAPYDFNQSSNFYPANMRVYLYTDRPIYRPGQPMYFRGVVRNQDDVTYTATDRSEIPILIQDDRGETVFEDTLPLTEYGTFSGQFEIGDDAGLGYYRLVAMLDPEGGIYAQDNFSLSFSVAEYRAPEFQVTVTPEADQVVQGETIRIAVESTFFFGGPVSNARVEYSVLSRDYFFSYTGTDRFSFIDFNYDAGPYDYYSTGGYGAEIAASQGTTDDQGMFFIEVPADLGDESQSQTYTVEARVTDESAQLVAGRAEITVHQGQVYVGVAPDRYVGRAGSENTINLIAVDWDSEGVAGQDVSYRVVERNWSSVQEEDEYGRTTWTWEVEEIPVEGAEGTVTTGEDGEASFTFTPPYAGTYKVYATTRDALGNEVRSSAYVWISGNQYVSWRQQNSNRIDLITDRDSYEVGDTAEILIASPWQGTAAALITIERGDVLFHDVVTLESNSTVYSFPIEDAYAPNVFVSVLLVKGVDENTPVPEFRMGMANIAVDPARREIVVTVTPDRDMAGPRETVTYTVETTDYAGNPVDAEVGVGLTDLSVLSIADPNSGPLMPYFYGEQGLAVRTAMPLTISVDQLTQTTLETVKGGGGGGGEGGIFEVRQEFVDTPYWNPSIVTGEDGQATFEVTLPDNLTTWRLDARAVTDGVGGTTLVGQTTTDIISTLPLLVRPVTPRFFVVGDAVTLAMVVNNNTGETMSVDASLQATGVTFNSAQDVTADIESGQRRRFEWMVTIDDVETVDLTFYASGNDGAYTDASKPPLGQGDDQLLP
ncbi:MAG: Ig-like domain-containing protein, partial [Anaerolineae bacterium]|nr:Ig-like domain-containing protein [Anaerolineae bacterium]